MQPDTLSALMEKFKQLYAMIKKVMKFQSSKNGSNFTCEKGIFSQIWSHMDINIAILKCVMHHYIELYYTDYLHYRMQTFLDENASQLLVF